MAGRPDARARRHAASQASTSESIFRQFPSVGGVAPMVSSSRFETGNKIYYSVYHSDRENASNYARGELRAYHLDRNAEGNVLIDRLAWEAGANYFTSGRQVITNKDAGGTPLA